MLFLVVEKVMERWIRGRGLHRDGRWLEVSSLLKWMECGMRFKVPFCFWEIEHFGGFVCSLGELVIKYEY